MQVWTALLLALCRGMVDNSLRKDQSLYLKADQNQIVKKLSESGDGKHKLTRSSKARRLIQTDGLPIVSLVGLYCATTSLPVVSPGTLRREKPDPGYP